jgi:hypothetical protein
LFDIRSRIGALVSHVVIERVAVFSAAQNVAFGRVSRVPPVQTAMRNCARDEGGPFEIGNQVLVSSHRKLLSSKAMVVSVAESTGQDPVRQG